MSMEIDNVLIDLAKARAKLAELKDEKEAAEIAVKQTLVYAYYMGILEIAKEAAAEVASLEGDARELAVDKYTETGIKDYDGVVVKLFDTIEYSEEEAVDWCLHHGHGTLLKLDRSAFEGVAKKLRPGFVSFKQEPRASISKDLSEYLEPSGNSG